MHWPRPGQFRPFGYNPVELSRFVVGAFPLVIQYPARLALEGSSPTLSSFAVAFPEFYPRIARSAITFDTLISTSFAGFSGSEQGFPAPPLTTVVLGTPAVTASFTPGYELSKPTDNPDPV
jgi:hypothetical protein